MAFRKPALVQKLSNPANTVMQRPFRPRPVSRYFRRDWNYALRTARIPALRPATSIIALMPLLQQFVPSQFISLERVWLLWWASLLFIGAVVVLKVRCPAFIQEYQNYAQYRDKGHSHRWIVWEFFNNLDSLSGWKHVIHETRDKHISLPTHAQTDLLVLCACPMFPDVAPANELKKYRPVNLNRDIYMPIWFYGERIVIAMQENDPALKRKIKELFWILFTQSASERTGSRMLFWGLLAIAGLLFVISFIDNVCKALAGKSLFDYLCLCMRWIGGYVT